VRSIRVRLEDVVIVAIERPLESSDISGAESLLAGAVHHVDSCVLGRELVGQFARAVRTVVINHEHLEAAVGLEESLDERSKILALAVRRDHY